MITSAIGFQTPFFPSSLTQSSPVHNYSIQTLNSTELATAHLRKMLARDPTHRYTYCQDYHSMTVVPIDVEAEQRAMKLVCHDPTGYRLYLY